MVSLRWFPVRVRELEVWRWSSCPLLVACGRDGGWERRNCHTCPDGRTSRLCTNIGNENKRERCDEHKNMKASACGIACYRCANCRRNAIKPGRNSKKVIKSETKMESTRCDEQKNMKPQVHVCVAFYRRATGRISAIKYH